MLTEKLTTLLLVAACAIVGSYIAVRAAVAETPRARAVVYAWDESQRRLDKMSADTMPPEGGKVWATCRAGEQGPMPVVLVKYDAAVRDTLIEARKRASGFWPSDLIAAYDGLLIRAAAPGSRWVKMNSPDGLAVRRAAFGENNTAPLAWPNDD